MINELVAQIEKKGRTNRSWIRPDAFLCTGVYPEESIF